MEQYEIQVVGHLDQRRARALGCEQLRLLPGRESVLTFVAVDQARAVSLARRASLSSMQSPPATADKMSVRCQREGPGSRRRGRIATDC